MSQNFGYSDRLGNDDCSYTSSLTESEAPNSYRLDTSRNYNKSGFLTSTGAYGRVGVSASSPNSATHRLDLVAEESLLKGLQVRKSNCKDGKYNSHSKPEQLHHQEVNNKLECVSSRLNNPAITSKGVATNRFYCLHSNPQQNIFWNSAESTRLSARDNYVMKVPNVNRMDSVSPPQKRGNKC